MFKLLICESCGKDWQVDYPSGRLTVRIETCQKCGTFKFQLVTTGKESKIPVKR